jgi:hypothetical protein
MKRCNVGDLVWVWLKNPWENPQFEWNTDEPEGSLGVLTEIMEVTPSIFRYWVRYPDGAKDLLEMGDFKVVASAEREKISRQASPKE